VLVCLIIPYKKAKLGIKCIKPQLLVVIDYRGKQTKR
jgi:hypothetical protein